MTDEVITEGDNVKVNYTGSFEDGEIYFERSGFQ